MSRRRENLVRCRRGFTLVELLVVIAIIALLMAILMPALGRAKKQAQAVVCQSRLSSWGIGLQMFTDDHDGYFFKNNGTWEEDYLVCMQPYIGARAGDSSETGDMFFCPSAPKTKNIGSGFFLGTTTSGWGPFPVFGPWWDTGAKGSYGINDWCSNPDDDTYWGFSSKYAYRSPNVSGRHNVPVFLDALFCDGYPRHTDNPPPYPDVSDAWNSNSMQFFCIDRHQGGVNVLFMDWSVRKVGLKELWMFKWSRGFDVNGPWTTIGGVKPGDWPEWMATFSDY